MFVVWIVFGDIDLLQFGCVDYYEYFFQVLLLLVGDEFDDEVVFGEEVGFLWVSGFEIMVDVMLFGLVCDLVVVVCISVVIGLYVVVIIGCYCEVYYGFDYLMQVWGVDCLVVLFVFDFMCGMLVDDVVVFEMFDVLVVVGFDGQFVCVGMLKGGVDYWYISLFECIILIVVVQVYCEIGVFVMVYLEFGIVVYEVLDFLGVEGVLVEWVVLVYVDCDFDFGLYVLFVECGVYFGYDGFVCLCIWFDVELFVLMVVVVECGVGDWILFGGDVVCCMCYIVYGGMLGFVYFGECYFFCFCEVVGEEVVYCMFVIIFVQLLMFFV